MTTPALRGRSARDLTNDQLVDVGGRLAKALLDPEDGLPLGDATSLRIARRIEAETANLALRMRMEVTGKFTRDKARQEKLRDDYVVSLRKGIRAILTDKDPGLPQSRRDAATLLGELMAKRPKKFETKSNAENTTQLQFLFADFDSAPAQAALVSSDLMRYYTLLKQAHAAYISLVAEEEKAEAASALALPSENPRNLPEMRAIKETLSARIRLTLEVIQFMAEEGLPAYAKLAERCATILTEVGLVARNRQTRETKAKGKSKTATAELTA
jgi:hypothetical protein